MVRGGTTRIDVTYFHEEEEYQVEVEALDGCSPEDLIGSTRWAVGILQGSPIYIHRKKFETVREILGGEGYYISNHIDTNAKGRIEEDRTTEFSIYSGQYQKPITLTNRRLGAIWNDTYITIKMDGVRKFLVAFNGFIYDVDPEHFHVRLMGYTEYQGPFPTVLDTELVDKEYHIIDVCIFEGKYIGRENLNSRLKYIERCSYLPGIPKRYIRLPDEDPVSRIRDFYHGYIEKGIPIDGIIFVRGDRGYLDKVIKWKPTMTIDLYVENEEIEERIIANSLDTNGVSMYYDGVYEFEILEIVEDEEEGPKLDLRVLRYREDKRRPNSTSVLIQNVDGFHLRDVWMGLGCTLMRKYHNTVKRKTLDEIIGNKSVVLDIGSGQGGDISKWAKAKKVYCIEPSKEAVKEFKSRLSENDDMERKIKIIRCRSSDTLKIFSKVKKVDIITAFFTLNLFTKEDLEGLTEIISKYKPRHFVGTFLDSRLVKYVDQPPCYTISPTETGYRILLHGTRIDQEEYRFSLDRLHLNGYKLTAYYPLNRGRRISEYEKELSAMYSYFHYERL